VRVFIRAAFAALALIAMAGSAYAVEGALRMATIGDLMLENGQILRNCRVGYRTWGTLDPAKTNAILVPTWLGGTSDSLGVWIGAGKLYDTAHYYVIAVDALGDGVSSSPSNSSEQPGADFPHYSVRDMVHSQYELVTRTLHLTHLFAVSGISMGGMQTFQWIVSYPDFVAKAVPIFGTPRQTAYDLLLWKTELDLIDSLKDNPHPTPSVLKAIAGIQALELRTPAWIASHVTRDSLAAFQHDEEAAIERLDMRDYASQLRAMIDHDIYRNPPGSPELAARTIKAWMLVVVTDQDHMVNPAPAIQLARVTRSEILMLAGDCGHLATGCEQARLVHEANRFLAEQ
jgi:homoserine O-acetyltransferase/O-succinyltransferase